MNHNDCTKVKEITETRTQDIERLCKHLENRRSLLLYGPAGIGKKTLVSCLAYKFCEANEERTRFYRVDPTAQILEEWKLEKCKWEPISHQAKQGNTTQGKDDPTVRNEERSEREGPDPVSHDIIYQPPVRIEERPETAVLIDQMLARVEQELEEQRSSDQESQNRYVLYLVDDPNKVPLSNFSVGQTGKLVKWVRQGVSLILLHKENLSETSDGFGDLYNRDTRMWMRYAIGLFSDQANARKAAHLLYKESIAGEEENTGLLDKIVSAVGPHPGQIAFAVEILAQSPSNVTIDTVKAEARRKFDASFQEIWESLGKEERRVLTIAAMSKLGRTQDDKSAQEELLRRCPDCMVDMSETTIQETKDQLASPRRRYGQLVLPWAHDRVYSDVFAEFILDQLPQPIQRKRSDRIFRRDIMLYFTSLVTLVGFISIFLSLINNILLNSIIVILLLVALAALILYALMFFARMVRS